MGKVIHVEREPNGAGLMRVTETHYYPEAERRHEVVRYEHRETPQVDHYGSHFTGNFAAVLIGGLLMAVLVMAMAVQP